MLGEGSLMKSTKDLIKSISEGSSAAHAYIVEGPSGSSRENFIDDIIKGLECLEIDIVRMQQSGKTGYKVEDAAALTERLGMRPYGKYLVGIIDNAELMSEVVQNKLLKTLEEPQEGTLLMLAAAKSDALLATVRSRCSLIRMQEYSGYDVLDEEEASSDLMEGAFMLLTQRVAFHEFREFLDKHIKTQEDALTLIGIAEDKLRSAMTQGKAMNYCADRIELAEKCAADIGRGMDKGRALKKLFLSYCDNKAAKA